jgi:hypothetical protein
MWKITLAGAAVIAIAAGASGPASACHGCDAGFGYGYFAYPKHFRVGVHQYYGFYDSCYKASPDGGFHSAVGRDCIPRAGKRRARRK